MKRFMMSAISIQLYEKNGGRIVTVQVSGRLEKADYQRLVPEKRSGYGMATFSKPFPKATVCYFDQAYAVEA